MTLILNRSQPGKACLLLPYIILEFLQLVGFGACIVLTVGSSYSYIFLLFLYCGKNKALFWFLHRSHGWWYTADDYCNTKDDNRDSWLQLTSTIWSPATFLGCLDSLSLPNIGDGDGGVQPWQCWDFYHHLYRCHWGESLSDRISTLSLFFCTEKKSIFKVMVMVILFYLWLCVVSLYQSLKEIQNLGSDQVSMSQKGWLSL